MDFDDPRVVELLSATKAVDRAVLGFSPIDRQAKLRLEWRPRAGYDAMLHVYGKTQRTVAFRRLPGGFEWIHEQETFKGPDEYDSLDGRFHETICITYETKSISGAPLNQVYLTYRGEDSRLTSRRDLTLSDVRPVLTEWGYGP